MKTYRGSEAQEYYETETEAYRKLKPGSGDRAPNIICFHGSFVRDYSYNLILEYADKGTLEDLITQNMKYPPSNGEEILVFWKKLFELFRGLGRIHFVEKDSKGPRIMLG